MAELIHDSRRYFEASMSCDADFKIKKVIFNKKVAKNKEVKFRIYEQNWIFKYKEILNYFFKKT